MRLPFGADREKFNDSRFALNEVKLQCSILNWDPNFCVTNHSFGVNLCLGSGCAKMTFLCSGPVRHRPYGAPLLLKSFMVRQIRPPSSVPTWSLKEKKILKEVFVLFQDIFFVYTHLLIFFLSLAREY